MLYLSALIAGILQIALGADIHFLGGTGYYLPALIIVSSGMAEWKSLAVWFAALVLSSFFIPLTLSFGAILFVLAGVCYFILQRWVDSENRIVAGIISSLMTALFIAALSYLAIQKITLAYAGSLILTFPVLIAWFMWNKPKRQLI